MVWLAAWILIGIASAFLSDVFTHKVKGHPWHVFSVKEILQNLFFGGLLGLIVTAVAIWLLIEHINKNTNWMDKKVSLIGRKPVKPDSE